jgi:hypothetical protein
VEETKAGKERPGKAEGSRAVWKILFCFMLLERREHCQWLGAVEWKSRGPGSLGVRLFYGVRARSTPLGLDISIMTELSTVDPVVGRFAALTHCNPPFASC